MAMPFTFMVFFLLIVVVSTNRNLVGTSPSLGTEQLVGIVAAGVIGAVCVGFVGEYSACT